jgi:hypothetical protein
MRRALSRISILSLIAAAGSFGQRVSPMRTGPVEEMTQHMCRHPAPPPAGSILFRDPLDALEFRFPAALQAQGFTFTNRFCTTGYLTRGEAIQVRVAVSANSVQPAVNASGDVGHTTEKLNNLQWDNYAGPETAEACTLWQHEQVCIFGTYDSSHKVSPALRDAVRNIESTLVFTGIAGRLDAKIAALRPGDRFCGLTVRRVLTRERIEHHPNPNRFTVNSYGAVDFAGTLTLRGSIEDDSTPNSPGIWSFGPDKDSSIPIFAEQGLGRGIELRNRRFFEHEIRRLTRPPNPGFDSLTENDSITVVLKNVAVAYRSPENFSTMEADLVSMTRTPPTPGTTQHSPAPTSGH